MSRSNKTLGLIAGGVGFGMLGLAFAADPLYDTFCRVTGYGGTTQVATKAPTEILDREVTVRFDANVADANVNFRPLQTSQTVKLGQHGLAFFEVNNPGTQPVGLIAAYNVSPHYAGRFFDKLECFCFTERVIQPGETKKLPVVYFVSADLLEDKAASQLETITLSYTFFSSATYEGPRAPASGATGGAAGAANLAETP